MVFCVFISETLATHGPVSHCDKSAWSAVYPVGNCPDCTTATLSVGRRRDAATYTTCDDYCGAQSLRCAAAQITTDSCLDDDLCCPFEGGRALYCSTDLSEYFIVDSMYALCTCTPARRDGVAGAELCDESSWSDVTWVCGDCYATVSGLGSTYQGCREYCHAQGLDCAGAGAFVVPGAEQQLTRFCVPVVETGTHITCDTSWAVDLSSSGGYGLCTCFPGPSQALAPVVSPTPSPVFSSSSVPRVDPGVQADVAELEARAAVDGPAVEYTTPEGVTIAVQRVSKLGGARIQVASSLGGTASATFAWKCAATLLRRWSPTAPT